MPLKTGIDMIEISRVKHALEKHGERFLEHIFTPAEIAESHSRPDSLAVRFAAKEAASKALGTGIGPVSWVDLEVLHHPHGEPCLVLHGRAAQIAAQLGLTHWAVSLSHSKEYGLAVVVASSD